MLLGKALQKSIGFDGEIRTVPYKYRSEPWTRVCSSDKWTVAVLDLLGGRYGLTGQFRNSTLGIHILTGILAKTSGLSTVYFANRYLFAPPGIASRTNYPTVTKEKHMEFTVPKMPRGNIWLVAPRASARRGMAFVCLRKRLR